MKLPHFLVQFIKTVMPKSAFKYVSTWFFKYNYKKTIKLTYNYKKTIEHLKCNEKVTVAFFMIHSSAWKLDRVYHLFKNDVKFKPIIVICPYIVYDEKSMLDYFAKCESLCKDRGYDYVLTYNKDSFEWRDIKKEISPDVIFFTNPWEGLTKDEYFITNFPDSLNCYVPYSSVVFGDLNVELNKNLHNYVWRFFLENNIIQNLSKKTSFIKGKNTIVTGFPGLDIYLEPSYKPTNVWKHNQPIKIIWAPHHTIDDNPIMQFSNFLKYYNFFVETARSYVDTIQIAFKPHPILKSKLYNLWGTEQTDLYYDLWNRMPNTQLEESSYEDLFASSSAMIFDSCSFITEYLYTKKPSLFLYKDTMYGQFNEFGMKALDCHKIGFNESDITTFIDSLIIGKRDTMAEKKEHFYNAYLVPSNHKSASMNIFQEIQNVLK
jgi:hypothetical protein